MHIFPGKINIAMHSLLEHHSEVHHAMHLATVRKLCEEQPLLLLKKRKAFVALPAPTKPITVTEAPSTVHEEPEPTFTELQGIADGDAEDRDGSAAGGRRWSLFGFGGKASKFIAK